MTAKDGRPSGSNESLPTKSRHRRTVSVIRNQAERTVAVVSHCLSSVVPFLSPTCCRRVAWSLVVFLAAGAFVSFYHCVLWSYKHSSCFSNSSTLQKTTTWKIPDTAPRSCPPVTYTTLLHDDTPYVPPERICLVTLTDGGAPVVSWWRNWSKCRDFSTTETLIYDNHAAYAQRHGYRYVMKRGVLDTSRPPAWSKIKAVQEQIASGKCEWVMWMDADVVIMNPTIQLESLIAKDGADLIVTPDGSFGVSSGVWLIRNTFWSTRFLQLWWNMRRFVRAKGLSLSGDNKAFGHLVQEILENETQREHIHVTPARCTMNSNVVFVDTDGVELSSKHNNWQGSTTYYHHGDFIAHAAGIDRKSSAIQKLVEQSML